jgi:hypothetical protein
MRLGEHLPAGLSTRCSIGNGRKEDGAKPDDRQPLPDPPSIVVLCKTFIESQDYYCNELVRECHQHNDGEFVR